MQILALVHRVPYPPNKGEKIRAFHEIDHLAKRGHRIDLATFADDPDDLQWAAELETRCRRVKIVPKNKRVGTARSVLALPNVNPLSVGYFKSYRLGHTVKQWMAATDYDLVFCYSSPMAEYVRDPAIARRVARVMDFVDVDSDKWRQYAEHKDEPMRSVYRLEATLLARYERIIAEEFDASLLVSEDEAKAFRVVAPRAREVVAIPNGVDTEYFGATARKPPPADAPCFVFVGQMDYFANVDGVSWFAAEIFPRIRAAYPSARFQIVGRAPTAEVKALAGQPGVEVTGGVPDVRDYLGGATIMVAPLRIARGIQNKVLEAMAARVPVVAAPAAFEGISGTHDEHALVEKDAAAFADTAVKLARDEPKKARLAINARRLVESKYGWAPAMQKLERLLEEKARAKRA